MSGISVVSSCGFDINRASWSGTPLDLALTEFKIIALLALRTGEDVSYRSAGAVLPRLRIIAARRMREFGTCNDHSG
jgi:hypothetical protein